MNQLEPMPPQSVLVYVGLDLLGDGLIKLPFVSAVRRAYPEASFTWLAGKGKSAYAGPLASLIDGLIDEIIDDIRIGSSWSELMQPALPGRSFDLIIDTQRRLLTTLCIRRIAHKTFVSGTAAFLFSSAKPERGYSKPPAVIDQMLDLVSLARHGRTGAVQAPEAPLALPDGVEAEAARLLDGSREPVALAPGAGGAEKRWPLERFGELANRIAETGRMVVMILGPGESEWQTPLATMAPKALFPLGRPDARLDLEPLLTIGLARRCLACVANDSGVGHLFAQAGVPQVSLFGPTPPTKFAPRTARLHVIRAQDFGGDAMSQIPVDAVFDAVTVASKRG